MSKMFNKKIFLLLLLSLLTSLVACQQESESNDLTQANNNLHENEESPIQAYGVVEIPDSLNIFIDFPVLVKEIHVKNGEKVSKGTPLLTLDFTDYQNSIKNKELELRNIENDISRLSSELNKQQTLLNNNQDPAIINYQNDIYYLESLRKKKYEEVNKSKELFLSGAISEQEFKNAEIQLKDIEKQIEDTKLAIQASKILKEQELEKLSRQIAAQKDQQSLLKNQLEQLKEKLQKEYLENNQLINPYNHAIVSNINCKKGDKIEQQILITLLNQDEMIINVDMNEEFVKDIDLNMPAIITPEADYTRKYKGRIFYISNQAIQKNGETIVPVFVSIDNPDEFLRIGFNVRVEFDNQQNNE